MPCYNLREIFLEVLVMKRMSTLFLKLSVIIVGIASLAICTVAIPGFGIANSDEPEFVQFIFPILACILTAFVPFFIALYQAWKLLGYIDRNVAFSELSVRALKNIKDCALAACAVLSVNLVFFYRFAEKEDAPGLIVLGMASVFASLVIALFAAVLQMLFKEAIDIKAENELTV